MRPSLTVSLLLLSLILSEQAQGIRLGKWHFMPSLLGVKEHKPIIRHEKEMTSSKAEKNSSDEEANVICKDGECSGNCRKLFITSVTPPSTTTTTTTTSKNEKMNGKNGQYSSHVNSLKTTSDDHDQHPDQNEPYPEVGDLAEMDYSPARRKSPIHN
ncbi:uncharacterized protein LOC133784359 [Humulus lupulus]|uniref:uncharacterized protein LOC133784359 n=1 Tax=Humulus lupulus TaxID=3486 RepID=UPI002B404B34|nr:uncharacterized protein LOC133784359 [Humulus lupulus]